MPALVEAGCRVYIPWLRGFGPTRFLESATPRSGQQAALGADLRDFLDALKIDRAIVCGYDWGGRAACIVAALWPERVHAMVSMTGYNLQDISGSGRLASASYEHRLWYQWYFQTERGGLVSRATATKSVDCCGICGHPTGSSTKQPSKPRPKVSKILISSTSRFSRTAIAMAMRLVIQHWNRSNVYSKRNLRLMFRRSCCTEPPTALRRQRVLRVTHDTSLRATNDALSPLPDISSRAKRRLQWFRRCSIFANARSSRTDETEKRD
jgi:pimeloyl-ACP methyl ester carboxylesterase